MDGIHLIWSWFCSDGMYERVVGSPNLAAITKTSGEHLVFTPSKLPNWEDTPRKIHGCWRPSVKIASSQRPNKLTSTINIKEFEQK